MNNASTTKLLALAADYAKEHTCSLGTAVIRLSMTHPDLTVGYRDEVGAHTDEPVHTPVISLRSHADATQDIMSLANSIATERRISLSAATKIAGQQRPDLGAAWERG